MKLVIAIWLTLVAFVQAAGLEFEQMITEVTAAADATTVTADFKFTNKGDKPVTISKSDPGCSCLKVQISEGKLQYAPGESGLIRTTFDMGNFSGTVDKMVALWLDDAPDNSPTMKLTVRVHIPVIVAVESQPGKKTLQWEIGGKTDPQVIHIVMAEGHTIHVTGITSSSQAFRHELKTIEDGKKYDLVVTPLELDTPGMCVIRIDTDCPIPKHRTQQAFAVMRRPSPGEVTDKP
jgi:Protein of unknown function (DUF1573)